MRIVICAVGRLKRGPEKSLVDDYLTRMDRIGRGLGLRSGGVVEIDDRKARGPVGQAAAFARHLEDGAAHWVLDERGTALTSAEFAGRLAARRDAGRGNLVICIGGADGLATTVRSGAALSISFGAMTWPHMLARVMLAEQLYRAVTILSGSPYHRA